MGTAKGVPGTIGIVEGVTMPDLLRSGWNIELLMACNIASSSLRTGERRSRLYTAVLALTQDMCLASTALVSSESPYLAVQEIIVDLQE